MVDLALRPAPTVSARTLLPLLVTALALATIPLNVMVRSWTLVDYHVYLGAAQNLLTLGDPYLPSAATTATEHFHYAPWFAAAMVPFLWLPSWVWLGLVLLASVGCLVPAIRHGGFAGWAVVGLFGGMLLGSAGGGNVQALLVLPVLYRLDRRDGPLWVALAASCKAAPILLVAYYVGRREWWKAGASVVLTALLVAPMLAFDVPSGLTVARSLVVWVALAGLAGVAALLLASGRYGRLAASAAVVLAFPRVSGLDVTWLLVAQDRQQHPRR